VARTTLRDSHVPVGTWRKRYAFHDGKKYVGGNRLKRDQLAELEAAGETRAVLVFRGWGRQYWLFHGRFHWEEDNLSADDAHALLYEKWRRRERQLERARAVVATESLPRQPRRVVIARDVKEAVFRRDGGRCVECGSDFDIQYDHIIPVVRGGSNEVDNLQILCATCNRKKGTSL
jgi:hypothetical protein